MKKQLIFIEGNIAASKSTILTGCREANFAIFEEPLDVWKERYCEKSGENILELFYKDTPRWSFTFEVAVLHTRFYKLLEAINHSDHTVILERSVWTDLHVFEPNCYAQGNMTELEHKIYQDWIACFMKHAIEPLLKNCELVFIYVRTPPEVCFQRKQNRDRKEEVGVVPDYFRQLHDRHDKWLLDADFPHKLHTIDGAQDQPTVLRSVLEAIRQSIVAPLKASNEDGAKVWRDLVRTHGSMPTGC